MAIKSTINASIGTVLWTSDETPQTIEVHYARLHPALQAYAALHGLKQKVGDAGAKAMGTADVDKFAAMQQIVTHLESGTEDWNLGRTASGASGTLLEVLIQAVIRSGKSDTAERRANIRALTPSERTRLAYNPKVKPHYDAIMQELTANVDTDAMLESL